MMLFILFFSTQKLKFFFQSKVADSFFNFHAINNKEIIVVVVVFQENHFLFILFLLFSTSSSSF
jgi:hypothetical protein